MYRLLPTIAVIAFVILVIGNVTQPDPKTNTVVVQPHKYEHYWGMPSPREACAQHHGVLVVSVGVVGRADIVTCRDGFARRVRTPR